MTTHRGFVQKIEVGRAGLVSVWLIHDDGTSGTYVIRDLDADPERFNERLSKLGILRDAMNRAEPVEIEHSTEKASEVIDRAARISRDALAPVKKIEQVTGLVLQVTVHSENGATSTGEKHDTALVAVISTEMQGVHLVLDLQAPERLVAAEQLEIIRDAQRRGLLIRFLVDSDADKKEDARIVAVSVDNDLTSFGREGTKEVSGFVETLSLIRAPFVSGAVANFAHVRFTTAPPFRGVGNTVGLAPFTPMTLDLLVPKDSTTYVLFEAGLRDNLRMRVSVIVPPAPGGPEVSKPPESDNHISHTHAHPAGMISTAGKPDNFGLVLAAELLAPLASASHPVWIKIERSSLDRGPDGDKCTPGVPSSDLTPLSLRDLKIPYTAVWKGIGCFNRGVYRFQLKVPVEFTIAVDGEKLCVYNSDEDGIKLAHACLGGEHTVTVELQNWICDCEFLMDVYRLR